MNAIGGGQGFEHVWIHIVGPFAGGALASVVFKVQNPDDV
jgi:glycerol uptake facilitator-like aquaporin